MAARNTKRSISMILRKKWGPWTVYILVNVRHKSTLNAKFESGHRRPFCLHSFLDDMQRSIWSDALKESTQADRQKGSILESLFWGIIFFRIQWQASIVVIKGPCSPIRLCALVFLFWNDSFVKCSVLIGFHFWGALRDDIKNDCEED